jgi:quercetin dioxygenase-like cupin family protein
VLEGDVGFGDLRLTAGDFEAAPPGTRHEVLRTESGCLLLIIASPGDEIFA